MKSQLGIYALVCMLIAACSRESRISARSPDELFVAETFADPNGMVSVRLSRLGGQTVFQESTGASAFQSWTLRWLSAEKLLVDTTDVGPFTYLRGPDGRWQKGSPLKKLSPDGKLVAYTFYHENEFLCLALLQASGDIDAATSVVREFKTRYACPEIVDCARWEGDDRIVVQCGAAVHSWERDVDGQWQER